MHRVSIVDPDAGIREALTTLLESLNIPVRTFASALELVDREGYTLSGCIFAEAEQQGLNGLGLLRMLRKSDNHVPYVLLTARRRPEFVHLALRDGASCVLEKPLLDGDVVVELRRLCGDVWPWLRDR